MTRIHTVTLPLAFAMLALFATGCPMLFGPPMPGDFCRDDCWTWCDNGGCKSCDSKGCDVPNSSCDPDMPGSCPNGTACDPDRGVCKGKQACSGKNDCGPGDNCVSGQCVPQRDPCKDNSGCGAGAYCKNGECVGTKKCAANKDCASLGSFVCDPRGTCVPGEPPAGPKTCTFAYTCPGGLCMDGKCADCSGDCGGGKTCQFSSHCGDGRACLNGKCVNKCTYNNECGSAQVCKSNVCINKTAINCTYNKDCAAGQLCVNSQCVQSCTGNGKCANPLDTCGSAIKQGNTLVKACHAKYGAQLECKMTKDCVGGETCVNGVCRTVCTSAQDCATCNDGHTCGPGGYCMTTQEASPVCKLDKECPAGVVCLNARCQKL